MTTTAALSVLLFDKTHALSPTRLRKLFEDDRSPMDILERGEVPGLVAQDVSREISEARYELESWGNNAIQVLTPFAAQYPVQLRSVFDYPLFLTARGHVLNDVRSVAVVGSREVSDAGLAFAAELARLIVADGVTVVSGLARGVDGSAHKAALSAGGRTVAVLGNGLDYYYPREHTDLQQTIADRGLVLSQYRPSESPTKRSFPARNVTMSAYSSITAIVEAREKSGTRIQAEAAVKHGRPLVITRQVAQETSWGKKYSEGAYNVAVVGSPAEARQAIEYILSQVQRPAPALLSA